MPVSGGEFREGLRRWASGVSIVTSRDGDVPCGMTASAFSSVSLHPPLVLICANKRSETHAVIARTRVFAVNVLAADQEALSRRFAREGNESERFRGLAWDAAVTGAPWIPGAIANLDCRVTSMHEAGDHVIYVGQVEAVRAREGEPLVYFRGAYRELVPAG